MKVTLSMETTEKVKCLQAKIRARNAGVQKSVTALVEAALVLFGEEASTRQLDALAEQLVTASSRTRQLLKSITQLAENGRPDALRSIENSVKKLQHNADKKTEISAENRDLT